MIDTHDANSKNKSSKEFKLKHSVADLLVFLEMRLTAGHSHTVYGQLHFFKFFFLKNILIPSLKDRGEEENMKKMEERNNRKRVNYQWH